MFILVLVLVDLDAFGFLFIIGLIITSASTQVWLVSSLKLRLTTILKWQKGGSSCILLFQYLMLMLVLVDLDVFGLIITSASTQVWLVSSFRLSLTTISIKVAERWQ